MSGLIENIARMSLTASIVILVVLTIRALMKRFPRKYVYMIWAAVWFRLLCPVSIESRLSLLT
ncbi:MAG: M56 family metallopeptidase [Saccharofermentans sp.]|nr:M56 family metallopeptidase [Saccharofermentans sp.]